MTYRGFCISTYPLIQQTASHVVLGIQRKKYTCKWTHTVQICVVQRSTVLKNSFYVL